MCTGSAGQPLRWSWRTLDFRADTPRVTSAPGVTDWKSRWEGAILSTLLAGVTQLVECLPSKQNVEGSSPFSRSTENPIESTKPAGRCPRRFLYVS